MKTMRSKIGSKDLTCLISSKWMDSNFKLIHYRNFCEIGQIKSADRLWLSETSINLSRL